MADLTIKGLIEILLRGSGAKDAKDQLDGAKNAAKGAKDAVDKTSDAFSGLERRITSALGGAVLARFVINATKEFAALERQLRTTSAIAERLGLDQEDAAARARTLTSAIQDQGDGLRKDTIPLYNKLLSLTESQAAAEMLLRAAVNASEQGWGELAETGQAVVSILEGQTRGAKNLGISLRGGQTAAEDQAQALTELIDRFGGASKAIQDTAEDIDQLANDWDRLKQAAAGLAAPILHFFVSTLPRAYEALTIYVRGATAMIGEAIAGMWSPTARATALANIAALSETTKALVADVWKDEPGIAAQSAEDAAEARAKILKLAEERLAAERKEAADKAAKEAADASDRAAAEARQKAERIAAIETAAQADLLREQLRATEEGSRERLKAEQKVLEFAHEEAKRKATEAGADVAAIDEMFRLAGERLEDEFADRQEEKDKERAEKRAEAEADALMALLATQAEVAEEGSADRLKLQLDELDARERAELKAARALGAKTKAIEDRYRLLRIRAERDAAKEEQQLAEEVARARKQAALDIASASVALAREVFGQTKAVAAAEVVVKTAGAVMSVWERWAAYPPVAAALTALVIATGAAQLANIESAQIGGGGGRGSGAGAAMLGHEYRGNVVKADDSARPESVPQVVQHSEDHSFREGDTHLYFYGNNFVDRRSLQKLDRSLLKIRRQTSGPRKFR